jgi:hypothetical protein
MFGFLSVFWFFGFWTRKSPALVKPGVRAVGDVWVIAGGDVAVSPALLLWVAVPPRLAP